VKKGDLVRWVIDDHVNDDSPCIIVRGPYEGYIQESPFVQVMIVLDLFVDGKIIRNIPLSDVHPWVIESIRADYN
jgi:hypothetical protein